MGRRHSCLVATLRTQLTTPILSQKEAPTVASADALFGGPPSSPTVAFPAASTAVPSPPIIAPTSPEAIGSAADLFGGPVNDGGFGGVKAQAPKPANVPALAVPVAPVTEGGAAADLFGGGGGGGAADLFGGGGGYLVWYTQGQRLLPLQ